MRGRKLESLPPRACEVCNASFVPSRAGHTICSSTCRSRLHRGTYVVTDADRAAIHKVVHLDGCGHPVPDPIPAGAAHPAPTPVAELDRGACPWPEPASEAAAERRARVAAWRAAQRELGSAPLSTLFAEVDRRLGAEAAR